jgi:uncharacterized protein (UPF0276 family)
LPKVQQMGVGIGYRIGLAHQIRERADEIDWVEFLAEEWLPLTASRRSLIEEICEVFPVAVHCTELSVGSGADGVSLDYVFRVKELCDLVRSPWLSDHMCLTHDGRNRFGHLVPISWTWESVERVSLQARHIQEIIEIPFLLENISSHYELPGDMSESEFFSEVLDRSDCAMLLDVANVYANSVNNNFDPYEMIDSYPLDRVTEIHIAGGTWKDSFLEDSHDAPVMSDVWDLLGHAVVRCHPSGILLERDANFPSSFKEISDELGRVRQINWTDHRLP